MSRTPKISETEGQYIKDNYLVMTDEKSFGLIREGSRISVNYRVTGNYTKLRIHRMVFDQIMRLNS